MALATGAALKIFTSLMQRIGTSVAFGAAPLTLPPSPEATTDPVPVPCPGFDIVFDSGSVGCVPPSTRLSERVKSNRVSANSTWSATPVSGWAMRMPVPFPGEIAQACVTRVVSSAQVFGSGGVPCTQQVASRMTPSVPGCVSCFGSA